jgi:hypothetical protein
MKRSTFPLILITFLAVMAALPSCKEFIEPSIAKREVQLEAPADHYQSQKYNINFWWDEVEDALGYRLQIVTPGFDTIGSLVLDTLVKGDKFAFTLDPGQYQWRVRAENGSSQTAFSSPRNLTVEASSLTGQTVILSSPGNNAVSNQKAIIFKWNDLFGATKFQVEIDTNNFADENALVYNQVIPGRQLSFSFPKDQTYGWRVRAENDSEQSKWSAVSFITYDSTPPGTVSLTAPANATIANLPVALKWNAVSGASNYKVYVYKGDSTSLYNTTFPALTNTTSYSFNTGSTGEKIYWKVTAIDAVGNEGKSSEIRNFTVQ